MPERPAHAPTLLRRVLATLVDTSILLVVPILWWHWSEWARYTTTFGRQLPLTVAMPVMALMPLTVLWLEAATARGAGKGLMRLRVSTAGGGKVSLGRSLLRAAVKWSPIWVGPAVWTIDAFARTTHADDFSNDYLLAPALAIADAVPAVAKPVWALNVSLRGMNWGVIPLAVLAAGYLLVLRPSGRTLLDYITRTTVRR